MSIKPAPLAHHFSSLEQQHQAASLGMWLFLATELMVFGGLFTGYAVYRTVYPDAWTDGSRQLNLWFAGVNTLVLLTSSLTMAMAVFYAQTGQRERLTQFLLLTAFLGAAFLVIKGFEYYGDYREELVPNLRFNASEWGNPRGRVQPTPEAAQDYGRHVQLFLLFYYIMTGLHGVHLIIGIAMLLILAAMAHQGRFSPEYYSPIDTGGLYWHFVDVVWIFLLPLLYLVA